MTGPVRLRSAGVADAAGIARVHFEASREGHREVLPEEVANAVSHDQRLALWQGLYGGPGAPPRVELAVGAGQEVLGFAWWRSIEPPGAAYDAEIINIYVRPGAQRRGLGRRLMAHTATCMADAGAATCYLWVFEGNAGARRFYEALGGRPVDRDWESYQDIRVPIVAYGWNPIGDLIARAGPAP